MNLKRLLLFTFTLVTMQLAFAQADSEIDVNDFDASLLENMIFDKLSDYRSSQNMDPFSRSNVLDAAAKDQANDFKDLGRVDTRDDVGKRVKKAGGGASGDFVALYAAASKGKTGRTYQQVADEIASKLTTSRSNQKKQVMSEYIYAGVAASMDVERKRIYFSEVLGGLDAVNVVDKKLRKSLPIKYTNKNKGLANYDDRACKQCNKFDDFKKLYDGLSIKGKYVYLSYDNLKSLQKLLRRETDGLDVEFVQRKQFRCEGNNIYDASLPFRGAIIKPYYSAKMWKKNEAEAKGRRGPSSFYGPIGKIKGSYLKKLPDDYELNLLVLQDKTVCKRIKRGYLEDGGIESLTIFSIYPDSLITMPGGWIPKAEKATLDFKVPFEQNKFDYKSKDIKPLMDAMSEPEYKVNQVFIEAHSSLEGDSAKNRLLQQRRAESILNSISDLVKTDSTIFKPENIKTTYGWEIFQSQIKGNKNFQEFQGKTYDEVKASLSNPEVYAKLDTLLREQRFAQVTMNVVYDVTGQFEEPFTLSQLKKAIDAKDGAKALKIQRYALRKVMEGTYKPDGLLKMDIPDNPNFVSLKINQIYLDNYVNNNGEIDENLKQKFEDLYKKSPENDFAAFNKYLVDVKYSPISGEEEIKTTQKGIDALYNGKITQQYVDALNLEYQFKVMAYLDSVDSENDLVDASLDRIKKIFNVEGSSWQNALKLGYIFISYNDLDYACKVMAPFLEDEGVDKELYFAYITAAAPDENKLFTKEFRVAMEKAKKADSSRFCKLFGTPYLSYQLLENPLIKEDYCDSCE